MLLSLVWFYNNCTFKTGLRWPLCVDEWADRQTAEGILSVMKCLSPTYILFQYVIKIRSTMFVRKIQTVVKTGSLQRNPNAACASGNALPGERGEQQ